MLQISRCYGASFPAVRTANPQVVNPNVIFPQTIIKVPNVGSTGTIYGPPCMIWYTVVSGDTWQSIANKFNADVVILQAANPGITLSAGVKIKVPVNSKGGPPLTPVTPAPTILNLVISPNPNVYSAVGQMITYNYAVTNSGAASVAGPVTIADNKIPGVICPNLNTVGNKDGNLDVGESITCSAIYTITQADINAGVVTNTATASAGGQISNQVSASIKAQPMSIVTLSVLANPTSYTQVNQNITFTYTITNGGATPLGPAQFVVNDTRFPGPINCGPNTTTLASNQSVNCSAVYIITQADITTGQIVSNATASGAGAATSQPVVTTVRYSAPTTQPIRLTFPPGNPSNLSQPGTINTPGTIRYVFAAVAGQTLNMQLQVSTNDVNLALYGPDNTTLKAPDAVNSWNGTLPTTGDYFIDLASSAGAASKNFTLNLILTLPAPASNTEMVADIYQGSSSSNPSYLSPFNAQLYFQANGNNNAGAELWRYDRGTNAASMVVDIFPGPTGSAPTSLRLYQNMLYFGANGNDGFGTELWRFNGSAAGRVNDLYSGEGSSNPMYMTEFNGELYFSANANDGKGIELWKFNGGTSATTLAADINPGPGNSNPSYLAVYNNVLYFAATTTNGGTELWKFDGSQATLASDIAQGATNANPAFLAVLNNLLYFSANGNNGAGTELWKFDGTNASMAADINPGPADSAPTYMTLFNNALFFGAVGNSSGFELWKFDGTTASMAADVNPAGSSNPAYLADYNNELYFQATGNNGAGAELWRYKGP
jgi:ELWxxDGT repeat protein